MPSLENQSDGLKTLLWLANSPHTYPHTQVYMYISHINWGKIFYKYQGCDVYFSAVLLLNNNYCLLYMYTCICIHVCSSCSFLWSIHFSVPFFPKLGQVIFYKYRGCGVYILIRCMYTVYVHTYVCMYIVHAPFFVLHIFLFLFPSLYYSTLCT